MGVGAIFQIYHILLAHAAGVENDFWSMFSTQDNQSWKLSFMDNWFITLGEKVFNNTQPESLQLVGTEVDPVEHLTVDPLLITTAEDWIIDGMIDIKNLCHLKD